MKRKVQVPGDEVQVDLLASGPGSIPVYAVMHENRVVVIFGAKKPMARIMTCDQANAFVRDLRDAHQALQDDAVIKRMEGEF